MQPIKFKGHNLTLAEDQLQYLPLPVCNEHDGQGSLVSCWKLTWRERLKMLITGKLFIRQLTFGTPFQPIKPMLDWKDGKCKNCGSPIGDHKHKTSYHCPPKIHQLN